ncbi:MAG TPA: site-2 protease family protein [Candidatus Polarisedimenticolaceae bacterium]|nr:site-2 protease family protein [Candidatus Polarisedimenticolaceae bacterium]
MPDPLPISPGRRILWLHAGLLAATILTTTMAGSWVWEGTWDSRLPWTALLDPRRLAHGIPYSALLLAILGAHEMGHYLACRSYGVPATLPFFIPGFPVIVGTLGAVIRIRGTIPSRRALFDIAAAGPIAGFVVAFPILVIGIARAIELPPDAEIHGGLGPPLISLVFEKLLHGSASLQVDSVYGAAWVGMLITSMNLFPVGQLDGGHALFAVSPRRHRFLSWLTIAATAGLIAWQVLVSGIVPAYTLWLVILLFLRGRHPRLLDETTPLGGGRVAVAVLLGAMLALTFIPAPFVLE